jgi:putative nucleotidyltransferase with HDIG domain
MQPGRWRVLVVDDEDSFGKMVSEALTQKGFETSVFTDPAAALDSVRDGRFAAAVLDLSMPGMGGMELAERIRVKSPDTQFLILTGHGDMASAVESIQHGVFDYLQKQAMPLTVLEHSVSRAVERFELLQRNHELMQRLTDTNHLLKALQDIGTSLTGESHLDRVLERLVAAAKQLCSAGAGRVLLFRRVPGSEQLIVDMAVGDGADPVRGVRLKKREGIAALAMESDELVATERAEIHERYCRRCDEMPTAQPGFLAAPLRHGSVLGALQVAGRADGFDLDHGEIVASLARSAAVAVDNALQRERSLNFFAHVSNLLVGVLDGMDVHYPGHSRRVAAFSDMVSRRLGMNDEERRQIHFAGLLHDIGKIRLDPAILQNEGKATPEQWRQIQRHPELGVEVLRPITVWEDVLPIILAHHERWDGKGYPRGLAGDEIPKGARIVAVAEVFDAISRAGPHVPGRTIDQALSEIERCAGTQFDPEIAKLFVEEYRLRADDIRV